MSFERGKDIKKTLSIGISETLDKYKICLIDETDFKSGTIPDNVWDPNSDLSDLHTDNLVDLDKIASKSSKAWVTIFHFKGFFKIVEIKINEKSYPEDWTTGYRYPEEMLPKCLSFFIGKMKNILEIPAKAAKKFLESK